MRSTPRAARSSTTRSLGGQGRSFKRKRTVKYAFRKPKINKRFKKLYDKCTNWDNNFGKYVYQSNVRLAQTLINKFGLTTTDENNIVIRAGGAHDILDAFSVVFGQKQPNPNYAILTNNLDDDCKYKCSISMDMFFKSTSSHVVNIEIYECTWKCSFNQDALTYISQCITSANMQVTTFNVFGVPAAATNLTMEDLNYEIKDIPEWNKNLNIKVHKIKLLPGDHTYKRFKICGMKTWDMGNMQQANSLSLGNPGTKQFFFRIINDVTVSGDVSAAKIHAFPSNAKGGVAMRYTKTYVMERPGNAIGPKENQIKYSNWNHLTETTDQQVLFHAPDILPSYGN